MSPLNQPATEHVEMSEMQAILSRLQGCNSLRKLQKIHAQVIINGYQNIPAISNRLLNFCAVSVSGSLPYAELVFFHIQTPQTPAWNSIIRGFSQSPFPLKSILYYNLMLSSSSSSSSSSSLQSSPDTFTFSFVLKACEQIKAEAKCREVHGSVIRSGYESDVVVCTNLVRAYAGNGVIEIARKVFDGMSERDLVTWNSMISSYCQAGLHREALDVYDQMDFLKVGLDGFTLVALLASCAHLGALNIGVRMHKFAKEKGCLENVFVGNALIDMYAKCGSLNGALEVFERMRKRNVSTWNSIIVACGVHGRGDEAIGFFKKMMVAEEQPNSITFLGLLCGCSHQGLVEEGVEYFNRMSSEFNLKPGSKHYVCMVDLFGRAGKFDKALETIGNSHSQADPVIWRALLGSCKIHRNMEVGEIAIKNLVQLGALRAGDCVLLARAYAEAKNTEGVARMRKLIISQGIKTTPGWSSIEAENQVHKFVVGDKSHPDSKEIYHKLKEVMHRITSLGYVEEEAPVEDPKFAREEECPELSGYYHSEKLAIAFGLARSPKATSLRIVKNLRVCKDCHSFTKFVSKAYNCEIIVRDRLRFHHFKGGLCSCKDYW